MILTLDSAMVAGYKSLSQQARVLTEHWARTCAWCPQCGTHPLFQYPGNRPVADFFCNQCGEEFELKSKNGAPGRKIVDGAYSTMMERLHAHNNPNLFFLRYNLSAMQVVDFLVVPRHFFVPGIIEKRPPLPSTARRAGWVGCNILLHAIPPSGQIPLIKQGIVRDKAQVMAQWQKTLFLRETTELSAKGWLLDVMRVIERINQPEFTLRDVYTFEPELSFLHPNNRHIKDKIRQQLQVLRDRGYLEFQSRGRYRLTATSNNNYQYINKN